MSIITIVGAGMMGSAIGFPAREMGMKSAWSAPIWIVRSSTMPKRPIHTLP